MSLMWTTSSRAPRLIAARRMLRPMRPKPLIAMRAMKPPLGLGGYIGRGMRSVKRRPCAISAQKTQRAPRRGARRSGGSRESSVPALCRSFDRFTPLPLQILRDELDQLGREREQLAGCVSARAKLLVEGPGQDAGPCGPVQRDGVLAVCRWILRGELFR